MSQARPKTKQQNVSWRQHTCLLHFLQIHWLLLRKNVQELHLRKRTKCFDQRNSSAKWSGLCCVRGTHSVAHEILISSKPLTTNILLDGLGNRTLTISRGCARCRWFSCSQFSHAREQAQKNVLHKPGLSSEISDLTPCACAHAQSNILHIKIKYAEKTNDWGF